MEKGSVDAITALLTAAANPKLTPGPLTWGALYVSLNTAPMQYEQLCRCMEGKEDSPEWNALAAFIAAARNGLRAFAEKAKLYSEGHLLECEVNGDYEVGDCTCGHEQFCQQIEAYLKSLPCPYDTDGDGNCGRIACPYCGKATKS